MDLYREGFLNKAGKGLLQAHLHSWRPRYFVLKGSSLKYYKSKEIVEENMLGCIELSEIECISLMKNEKNSFQITIKSPKSRTYYMSGKSDNEVMGWIRAIEMARAKLEKHGPETTPVVEVGVYDEVKPPAKTIESKPSLVHSKYSVLNSFGATQLPPPPPPSSPSTDSPKAATKPVPSEYQVVGSLQDAGNNSSPKEAKNGDDETVSVDSTYEMVVNSQPEVPKRTSVENVGAVYDEPSLGEENVGSSSEKDDDENVSEDPTYDMVLTNQSEAPIKQTNAVNVDDVYDEPSLGLQDKKAEKSPVAEPPPLPMRPPSLSEKQEAGRKKMPIGVYDEVGLVEGKSSEGNGEAPEDKGEARECETAAEIKEKNTLPIYAKPIRRSSKRKLNPAMMDIGEVSADVEVETAGGSEALKLGMTKPMVALDELKEILHKYNEEDKNNMNEQSEAKLDDFDVDQGESAFDTLKRFLQKHG